MRNVLRTISVLLLGTIPALGGALQVGLAHDTKTALQSTLVGDVVDLAYYVGHNSIGDSHRECATSCAKAGVPLAILDQESRTLYLPLSKNHRSPANSELMRFVERDVRITGNVVETDGMKTILLESVEASK